MGPMILNLGQRLSRGWERSGREASAVDERLDPVNDGQNAVVNVTITHTAAVAVTKYTYYWRLHTAQRVWTTVRTGTPAGCRHKCSRRPTCAVPGLGSPCGAWFLWSRRDVGC